VPPKPKIADALAAIATSSPDTSSLDHGKRDPVVRDNRERDHVAHDNRERDHVLRDHVVGDSGERDPAPHDPVTRFPEATGPRGTDADGYRTRVRREKPHVSLYAHPRTLDAIRDLALAQRRKPHDLYLEGLRLMLARYGLDFDALERG
jgi:hypothetical protein